MKNPGLAASLGRALANLEEEIADVETQLEALVKKECAPVYGPLRSIPGIGPKTALMLLTLTRGFTRFGSSAQLACFAGLAPAHYQSGTSLKGSGHLIKMGAGQLRRLLYMAAIRAKEANPACRALYERRRSAGKAKLVALLAVAHKLLRQAFSVAKWGRKFDLQLT